MGSNDSSGKRGPSNLDFGPADSRSSTDAHLRALRNVWAVFKAVGWLSEENKKILIERADKIKNGTDV